MTHTDTDSPSLWLLVKCRETKALYFFLAADNLTTSTDLQRPMKGLAVLWSFSPFSHYRLLLHICSICLITTPSVLPLRALPGSSFIPCWRTPTGTHSSLQYVLHIIPFQHFYCLIWAETLVVVLCSASSLEQVSFTQTQVYPSIQLIYFI